MTDQSNDRTGSPAPTASDHLTQEEATRYGPAAAANGHDQAAPPADREATNYSAPPGDAEATNYSALPADPEATGYTPTPPPSTRRKTSHLPRRFGDYELLEEIARGGMGVVYKARQLKADRIVALKKILSGHLAGPDAVERFVREARAAAGLDHPGIVPVHEVGEVEGEHFFSMALVEGGSLKQRLAQGPLPPREAARLVRQVAEAVQYAHERGVVHRDIKPHNVLLAGPAAATVPDASSPSGPSAGTSTRPAAGSTSSSSGGSGSSSGGSGTATRGLVPKLTDFGLARTRESGLSVTGEALGTPEYMPPEQARGDQKRVGPWSDVYSLGALLYALVVGRPPFQSASPVETMHQVLHEEPLPPRQLDPGVPADLETVCLKCLHKEPGRRYGTAREVAEELGRFEAGRPVLARPVGRLERSWRWCQRNPAVAGLLAAVFLMLLLGTAVSTFFAVRANANARLADQMAAEAQASAEREQKRAENAERQQERAAARERLRPRVQQFLKGWDEVLFLATDPMGRGPLANRDQVRRLASAVLDQWGIRAESGAEAARALDSYRGLFESPQQAEQVAVGCYEVLLVWAEAEAEPLPSESARTRQAQARKALKLLDAANALGQANKLPTPQAFHARRAQYLAQAGDDRAAEAARQLARRLPPTTAQDLFLTALGDYRAGQTAQAAWSCDRALRRQPDHYWAQYLRALCRLKAGEWAEARGAFSACLALRPEGPPWPHLYRATAEALLKDFDDAEADFAAALGKTADPLARYVVLTNRGASRIRQQRWDGALADLGEAVKLRPDDYQAYLNLAQLYRGRRDWGEALTALDAAIRHHANDTGLYRLRARTHLERNDQESARHDFERVVALESAKGPSDLLASACVELARLRHRGRDFAGALDACARALAAQPGYALAHRQRTEELVALGRYEEAGQALDAYLKARGARTAVVYKVRGLIYAKLCQYPLAVEAFSRALAFGPDAEILSHRGWAYLKLNADGLALADFEAALKLDPACADAMCGMGHARLSLGDFPGALAAAERTMRLGRSSELILLNVACLYARAATLAEQGTEASRDREKAVKALVAALREARVAALAVADAETVLNVACLYDRVADVAQRELSLLDGAYSFARMAALAEPGNASRYRKMAAVALDAALRQVPEGRRRDFWRQRVEAEPALQPLRSSAGMLRLAGVYGGRDNDPAAKTARHRE